MSRTWLVSTDENRIKLIKPYMCKTSYWHRYSEFMHLTVAACRKNIYVHQGSRQITTSSITQGKSLPSSVVWKSAEIDTVPNTNPACMQYQLRLQTYFLISQNKVYYAVRGHLRSSMSVSIEIPDATSYLWLIVTNILSHTVTELQLIVQIFDIAILSLPLGA